MTVWGYLHSFSRCWLATLRNPKIIRGYSRSRSSKAIDLGVNQKRICDFLLVINSNFGRISYGFRDIDAFIFKIACFPTAPLIVWHRPRNRSSRSIESIVWGLSRVELREGPKVESTDRVDRLTVELSWGNGSRLSRLIRCCTYWIQHWWDGQNIADCRDHVIN